MSDDGLPRRTLKTTFWLSVFSSAVFLMRGQNSIALGLICGSGLGLFSLGSLVYVVPRLFQSGNPTARMSLAMIALFKLPIYVAAIYFITGSHYINPLAVFAGVALTPGV